MPDSHGQTTLLLAVPPSPEPLKARTWAATAAEAAAAGDQGRQGNADGDEDEPPREEARAVAVPAGADGRALVVALQGGNSEGYDISPNRVPRYNLGRIHIPYRNIFVRQGLNHSNSLVVAIPLVKAV